MNRDEHQYAGSTNKPEVSAITERPPFADDESRIRQLTGTVQRSSQRRRLAFVLAAVGVLTLLVAALLEPYRELLVVLGVFGVYAAALVLFLPEHDSIRSDVATYVYATQNRDRIELVRELGLSDASVYVPTSSGCRLFVPRNEQFELPDPAELASRRLLRDRDGIRGATFRPCATWLYDSVQPIDGVDSPTELAEVLRDTLVDEFQLVDSVESDVDSGGGTVVFELTNCRYGGAQFDHPVTSFLAIGMVAGLGRPVTAEQRATEDDATTFEVVLSWEP
ncbi:hypothetical protein [Halogeometricum limi]|uniref:DUF7982 domain-containing protein n=1 Tax=Halogeometricum limi TaxID=555875 RepID=A0A1I6IL84_9EURY|nr:hypothetical protein [Halogeometricum limi]SFR67050.1 hypothetical protein SAMN04488124_3316 [Halogeometricum limi]